MWLGTSCAVVKRMHQTAPGNRAAGIYVKFSGNYETAATRLGWSGRSAHGKRRDGASFAQSLRRPRLGVHLVYGCTIWKRVLAPSATEQAERHRRDQQA